MGEQDGIMQTTSEPVVEETIEQAGTADAQEVDMAYQSMEELLEKEVGFRELQTGDIVTGTVERIDEHGALVNVGAKSEGLVPPEELGSRSAQQTINVGDEIYVYVMSNGSQDGNIILSKKKADYEKAWNDIIKAYENNDTLVAMVIDRVRGGLVVDLGMRGFLPASHVATKNVNALDRFVGQSVKLKVIEVDRNRKRVVVSQKKAVEEEKKVRREQTVTTLEEGQIRRGVVRRVTDYGAFVDLGGIDGLLHVTEMSWGRVNHPSDIVKPGQKIDVMVLKYDPETEKISLGLKQILPDPWQHVDEFYMVGEEVDGTVTRIVPFGAFVALEHGIEGIIPNSELSDRHIRKPEEVVSSNQRVRVKIINIRPNERRMTLSLRQIRQPLEDEEGSTFISRAPSSGITIGEMLGDVFTARESEPVEPEHDEDKVEVIDVVIEEPVEDAVEPVEDAVEPVEDVVEPVEVAVEPVEDAVEPAEDAVEPADAPETADESASDDASAEDVTA